MVPCLKFFALRSPRKCRTHGLFLKHHISRIFNRQDAKFPRRCLYTIGSPSLIFYNALRTKEFAKYGINLTRN